MAGAACIFNFFIMNGNNVLLIWPKTDKGYYDLNPLSHIFGQKGAFFPLPLLCVASALGDSWNYSIADENVRPVSDAEACQTDFFLISCNVLQRNAVENLLARLEPYRKPIIVGGPISATIPDAFSNRKITKVIGEIEGVEQSTAETGTTVAELLSLHMKAGALRPQYRSRGFPDLRTIRPPRIDLLKSNRYFTFSMQTSRGCHNNCDFCQERFLYGTHRRKNTAQVMAELDQLVVLGRQRCVFIIDDNFTGNVSIPERKREISELLDAMYQWQRAHQFPFDFFSQCSIEIADHDDLMELMARAGLNLVFLGIETINSAALKSVHKTQNVKADILSAIDRIRGHGIGIMGGLIVGFDEDTADSVDAVAKFVQQSSIPFTGISLLFAPPGTRLYSRLYAQGRISGDPDALTKSFRTNIIPKMHPAQLYGHYFRLAKTLYSADAYFSRCLRWTDRWNDSHVLPGTKGSVPANLRINRIARSVFHQGFLSRYRFHYWIYVARLIVKFRRNRNKIAVAMYLGYFFSVIDSVVNHLEKFMVAIPEEIISEWEAFQKKSKANAQ